MEPTSSISENRLTGEGSSISSGLLYPPETLIQAFGWPLLVVGDKSESIVRLCSPLDVDVTECSDGNQALEALGLHSYRALICGVNLSKRKCMKLLAAVRQSFPEVAVVTFVKRLDIARGILAMIDGASGYIVTPNSSNTFIREMDAILERHRLNRVLEKGAFGESSVEQAVHHNNQDVTYVTA